MNKNVERYKLCLQCTEENAGLERYTLLGIIRHRIETKRKWTNPMYQWIDCNGNGGHVYSTYELCSGCSYVLEHTILEQGEVHVQGCRTL